MPNRSRQLAAIMFTDIVGYTALMSEDEEKGFELLEKNRQIHRPIIERFQGRWIKEIGDGVLASFMTVSDAVYCAGAIQKACENEPDLNLRIGIHLGEVVFEGKDVFGDGVNIASRLEQLAPSGGIMVSESVYNNVLNKKGIESEFVKEENLKNVKQPIKVYQLRVTDIPSPNNDTTDQIKPSKPNSFSRNVVIGGAALVLLLLATYVIYNNVSGSEPVNEKTSPKEIRDKSIAVIPFNNLSNDPDQDYFSDGMMEEILTHLYKIGDLKVMARNSVMGYKGTTKTIKEIGKELGVGHILAGSVQKNEGKVKINVQLIDTTNEQYLWAESYDNELTDLFAIQSDIAQQVALALEAVINPEVQDRIETNPTETLEAYDYYLRGNELYWSYWNDIDHKKILESIEYYKKAIEIDTGFSTAYAGLGRSYWHLAFYQHQGEAEATSEFWEKSRHNLNKAITLDPYNGMAYSEMSVVTSNWDWDSAAARTNLDLALKFIPNDLSAYFNYSFLAFKLGKCEKLNWILKELKALDPKANNPYCWNHLILLRCQKDYSKIAAIADQYSDELNQNLDPLLAFVIFDAYLHQGNYNRANHLLDYIRNNVEQKSIYFVNKAMLNAKQGNKDITYQMLDSIKVLSEDELIPNTWYAAIFASLGKRDAMYEHLLLALKNRETTLQDLNTLSEFNPYKAEPRFKEIIEGMWVPRDQN